MEVAEVEIDICGIVLLAVVLLDRDGAGIGAETDAGDIGVLVGLDVHGAEGCAHAHVVSVAMLAVGDIAAGEEHTSGGGEDGQSKRVHRAQLVHHPGPLAESVGRGNTPAHGRIRRWQETGSVNQGFAGVMRGQLLEAASFCCRPGYTSSATPSAGRMVMS